MEEIAKELRNLYPGCTERELKEIRNNLDNYLQISFRVFKRIQDEKTGSEKFESPWTVPQNEENVSK